MSFQLKYLICAVLPTSFRLLCVNIAFSEYAVSWSNKSWVSFCCSSSETYIFLIKCLRYSSTTTWHEINTLECFHSYFLYPCSAHLHEIDTSCLIVLDLKYFSASMLLTPSFTFLLKVTDKLLDMTGIIRIAQRLTYVISYEKV